MEIIDIYWNPKQQNETKQAKRSKWPIQNDQNGTTETTKKVYKKINNDKTECPRVSSISRYIRVV